MYKTLKEMFSEDRGMTLSLDANPYEGMLLRTGTGQVKRLSTKRPWAQGGSQSYGVEVRKVPRAIDASEVLTHPVGELELKEGLGWMEYHTPGECLDHLCPRGCDEQLVARLWGSWGDAVSPAGRVGTVLARTHPARAHAS